MRIYEEQHNKPPIGVKPKHIHDHIRALEIIEAIQRYVFEYKTVPHEWISELKELIVEK